MIVIGNQIRMDAADVEVAVEERHAAVIVAKAKEQVAADARMVMLEVSGKRPNAVDDMAWLVTTVQDAILQPLVLRSDDPAVIEAGLEEARREALIDATGLAVDDVQPFINLAAHYKGKLTLSVCPGGIPTPIEERIGRATEVLIPEMLAAGIPAENIYIDPLVSAISCDQPMVPVTLETLRSLKVAAEKVPNTLAYLYNVSDGTPASVAGILNSVYLAMLMGAGLDAVVADPLDAQLQEVIHMIVTREALTPLSRLFVRVHDSASVGILELEPAEVDMDDEDQASVCKTVQVLVDQVIYADAYLDA